ncbi:hypothetical protein PT974_11116 [Cladobotryum mycophilum]|uniref:Uncharacterized protein n=1 Tax=Cladobotryum mycophilum TaxID=491253 RepID=A0ABR0S5A3_9HYPO
MNTHLSPHNEDAKIIDFHHLDFKATFQLFCLKAGLKVGYIIHPERLPRISHLEYQARSATRIKTRGEHKWLQLFESPCIKVNIAEKDRPHIEATISSMHEFEVPLHKTVPDLNYYIVYKEVATDATPAEKEYSNFTSKYTEYGGNLDRIPAIGQACSKVINSNFNPDLKMRFDPRDNLDRLLKRDPETWIHWFHNISW